MPIYNRRAPDKGLTRRSLIQWASPKEDFSMNQRSTGYELDLRLWIEYQGDTDIKQIRSQHIVAFLTYLRTDYVPRRLAGDNSQKLSPETVYNIYISLASFYAWASRELNIPNPVKAIPRPRVPADAPVQPFKKEEVEALIRAC